MLLEKYSNIGNRFTRMILDRKKCRAETSGLPLHLFVDSMYNG